MGQSTVDNFYLIELTMVGDPIAQEIKDLNHDSTFEQMKYNTNNWLNKRKTVETFKTLVKIMEEFTPWDPVFMLNALKNIK
jgi:hypothetical protein